MWRNYLSAALRNLFRNRAYAALNIAGLALSFAAAILITLYVRDEYSLDDFVPEADRIHYVQPAVNFPGRPTASGSVVASNIAWRVGSSTTCPARIVMRNGSYVAPWLGASGPERAIRGVNRSASTASPLMIIIRRPQSA